jgi:hypothetical protein
MRKFVLSVVIQKGFISKNELLAVENIEVDIYFMKIKNSTLKYIQK